MSRGVRLFGHPVHPVLVHFPVACWLLAPACDVAWLFTDDAFWATAALWLTGTGVAFALMAAIAGMIDLAALEGRDDALRTAGWHVAFVSIALTAAILSLIGRWASEPEPLLGVPWPLWAGALAALATLAGGWFGGRLVYTHGAGRS
ncbi:MAG: DUF2231 domain-containing protein [Alphaproteobacteria bacterium]